MKIIRICHHTSIILLALILVSCVPVEPKMINTGQSSYFQPERIRTIAMMPLQNDAGDAGVAEEIVRELTVQILQLGRFEVIDHYKVSALVAEEALEDIDVNDAIVRNLGRKLRADAILLGKVTAYQAGQEKLLIMKTAPVIGLSLRMISVKERIPTTIWTVNDTFNGGDAAVKQLVEKSNRGRIQKDVHFLIKVMCSEIAKTLNF
ncbi:MAG: hypothetical protein O7E52_13725 [Candidatus Poribacteria bacterium]|nr:hypothetical protein [Candidatus Poribacteria bacterium]